VIRLYIEQTVSNPIHTKLSYEASAVARASVFVRIC